MIHQANWQYTCTKYALRGLMRVARRNSWEQGIRINYVAPWYSLYFLYSLYTTLNIHPGDEWLNGY